MPNDQVGSERKVHGSDVDIEPRGPVTTVTAGSVLVLACRLAIGLVFIIAAMSKVSDPGGFAHAVYNYHLLPLWALHPFALLLPWVELVIGAAMLAGIYRQGAALLAGLLTLLFMVAVASALARNLDISCGCFHTEGGSAVGLSLLFRDLALLVACGVVLLSPRLGRIAEILR
jgi:putative oxidoreductase